MKYLLLFVVLLAGCGEGARVVMPWDCCKCLDQVPECAEIIGSYYQCLEDHLDHRLYTTTECLRDKCPEACVPIAEEDPRWSN